MKELIARVRPQVLIVVIGLVGLALYSVKLGYIEIATGCIGILGAVSNKLIEKD